MGKKRVLITAGGSGICRSVAEMFIENKAKVLQSCFCAQNTEAKSAKIETINIISYFYYLTPMVQILLLSS
jgi:NAD(P)-dependent dehydrogenase (short-subunit alcohol dehydrogenase family)